METAPDKKECSFCFMPAANEALVSTTANRVVAVPVCIDCTKVLRHLIDTDLVQLNRWLEGLLNDCRKSIDVS